MTRKKKKKPEPVPTREFPVSFDVFGEPSRHELRRFENSAPSCFNGFVFVEKFRVTFERIEEPVDVVHERLLALWRGSNNHHDIAPLRAEAKRHGLVLEMSDWGRGRK
jgi:hypothetical protein